MAKISVVVCTHNRAALLNRLLGSLYQQTLDKMVWGIVVVDNNSSDNTKDIVDEWQKRLSIKYVEECQQGLSYARNAGIRQSNSDYLLYLDDDVYAESILLESYYKFVNSTNMSSIACLGGKIIIEWEGGKKPAWFPEKFENLYALHDLGNQVIDTNIAVGCNMLWGREVLLTLGGFEVGLGRKGNTKLASEETLLLQKAQNLGLKIKYIPDAVVRHWTPYSRQRRSYLFEICYWLGISKSKIASLNSTFSSPKEAMKQNMRLLRNLITYFANLLFSSIKKINILSEPESVYWFGMILFVVGDLLQNMCSAVFSVKKN